MLWTLDFIREEYRKKTLHCLRIPYYFYCGLLSQTLCQVPCTKLPNEAKVWNSKGIGLDFLISTNTNQPIDLSPLGFFLIVIYPYPSVVIYIKKSQKDTLFEYIK